MDQPVKPIRQILWRTTLFIGTPFLVIVPVALFAKIFDRHPLVSIYIPLLFTLAGVFLFLRYREYIAHDEDIQSLSHDAKKLRLFLYSIPMGSVIAAVLFVILVRSIPGLLASLSIGLVWWVTDKAVLEWSVTRASSKFQGKQFLDHHYYTLYLSFIAATLILPVLLLFLTIGG